MSDPFVAQGDGSVPGYPLTDDEGIPEIVMGHSSLVPAAVEPAATEVGETTPMTNVAFLRVLVQEPIPVGGADTDTMFTDQNIVEILNRSFNVLSAAASMAWFIKAGALLVLTDRNDGLSEKKLSQASVAATKIAQMWDAKAEKDLANMGRSIAPVGAVFDPYAAGADELWNQIYDASHPDRFYLQWGTVEG